MKENASFALGAGAWFGLELPADAAPIAPGELPAFDVGPLSGVEVVAKAGWRGSFGALYVACAAAPSSGFAPGVADLVLARATAILQRALPDVGDLAPSPAVTRGGLFLQDVRGERVVAAHALGFTARGARAFLCTTACAERHDAAPCARAVASARPAGALAPPPPPSLAVRALFAAAEHPVPSTLAALALITAASIAVVARRPRRPARLDVKPSALWGKS